MKKNKPAKRDQIINKAYTKLMYFVELFVVNMHDNQAWNADLLASVDEEWKIYTSRINTLQNLIHINPEDFSHALADRLRKLNSKPKGNPKGNPKDKSKDNFKLKTDIN